MSWEERRDGGGLRCEAGFVDAVIDVVVSPVVGFVNLLLQVLRVEVDFAVLFGQEVVEFGVEHADDLARFVTDDGLLLLVVEGWHGEAALVVWVYLEVDVSEVADALDGIWSHVLAWQLLVVVYEAPAFLKHLPVNRGVWYDVLEAFQFAGYKCTMRPRASV